MAIGTAGDAAAIDFVYRGQSRGERALASGQIRRQIGLKLRAANGCNLVYAMWRFDPRPQLEVSVKINPGARTHAECGARGYTKLRPVPASEPVPGQRHTVAATIAGDELRAWIDGQLIWQGYLPAEARGLVGPAGLRSDNVAYDLQTIWATPGNTGHTAAHCLADGED
ncbi:MAG TPA: hypothetical protein VLE97_05840 [Gaiellaceae bacterium]|nr:hypothetical protein [Gaiellaceae bacterium]